MARILSNNDVSKTLLEVRKQIQKNPIKIDGFVCDGKVDEPEWSCFNFKRMIRKNCKEWTLLWIGTMPFVSIDEERGDVILTTFEIDDETTDCFNIEMTPEQSKNFNRDILEELITPYVAKINAER